jgi:hypothetical protein
MSAAASCDRSTGMYHSERRVHQRYPISLEVEYQLLDATGVKRKGIGRTVNISSSGILVHLEENQSNVNSIQLSVKWPFLLDGLVPLQWIVRGNIVRADGDSLAVEVINHAFHTAGKEGRNTRNQR